MGKIFRIFTSRVLWLINIAVALMLVCTKFIPLISPAKLYAMGLLGLTTPFIAGINILFVLLWVFFRKWWRTLLSITAIIIAWQVFSVGFAGTLVPNKLPKVHEKTYSILSYNVRLFDLYKWSESSNTREKIIGYLHQKNADILCLQEIFSNDADSKGIRNVTTIATTMGYKYFARNINFNTKRGYFGDIIFSKYPILQSESFNLDTSLTTHKFQYADIILGYQDTIRVFNLHLQSVKFSSEETVALNAQKTKEIKKNISKGKLIISKLGISYKKRSAQAEIVREQIESSPYPAIVCGDFNDIPSSYTYFKVRGSMQDAFLKKGFGLGRTYTGISPILRIDYLFFNENKFKILALEKDKVYYSDHFPIKVWFGVNK